MAVGVSPSGLLAKPVIGHQVQPDLARIVRLQVTKLAPHVEPPFGHDRGKQGRIAVGCNIPVVGKRDLSPVHAVQAKGGGQHAGLALVTQWKAQDGNGENGYSLEAEYGSSRQSNLFFVIKVDTGRAQYPVRHPAGPGRAFAGGERGILDGDTLVAQKINAVCFPMGSVFQKPVAGLREKPFKCLDLEFQQRPLIHIASLVDVDIAPRARQVVGLKILHAVSTNDHVAPAKLGIALHHRFEIRTPERAIALQERWQGLFSGCPGLILQQGAALELDAFLFGSLRVGTSATQQTPNHKGNGCQHHGALT